VQEHVGVAGVGHGAGALLGADAAAQLSQATSLLKPDGPQVIAGLAQVAHRIGAHAAGPDVAIRGDVRRGPASVAGDDLPPLGQNAFGELVVRGPEGGGEAAKTPRRRAPGLGAQEVGEGAYCSTDGVMSQPSVPNSTRSSATSVM